MNSKKLIIYCPAKINLYLNTKEKRSDQFHSIESFFHTISLNDTLEISTSHSFHLLFNVNSQIPIKNKHYNLQENNLLEKVYSYFKETYNISPISIEITKNIPVGAGLGGASTNAAGLIIAINELFNLNIPFKEIFQIADHFGSDVPYFLKGGLSIVEGKGEKITTLPVHLLGEMVLVYPDVFISSKEAFSKNNTLNLNSSFANLKSKILAVIDSQNLLKIQNKLILSHLKEFSYNSFEKKTLINYPKIAKAKEILEKNASFSLMSGSGSSVFAIFHDIINADKSYLTIKSFFDHSYRCSFVKNGIQVTIKS